MDLSAIGMLHLIHGRHVHLHRHVFFPAMLVIILIFQTGSNHAPVGGKAGLTVHEGEPPFFFPQFLFFRHVVEISGKTYDFPAVIHGEFRGGNGFHPALHQTAADGVADRYAQSQHFLFYLFEWFIIHVPFHFLVRLSQHPVQRKAIVGKEIPAHCHEAAILILHKPFDMALFLKGGKDGGLLSPFIGKPVFSHHKGMDIGIQDGLSVPGPFNAGILHHQQDILLLRAVKDVGFQFLPGITPVTFPDAEHFAGGVAILFIGQAIKHVGLDEMKEALPVLPVDFFLRIPVKYFLRWYPVPGTGGGAGRFQYFQRSLLHMVQADFLRKCKGAAQQAVKIFCRLHFFIGQKIVHRRFPGIEAFIPCQNFTGQLEIKAVICKGHGLPVPPAQQPLHEGQEFFTKREIRIGQGTVHFFRRTCRGAFQVPFMGFVLEKEPDMRAPSQVKGHRFMGHHVYQTHPVQHRLFRRVFHFYLLFLHPLLYILPGQRPVIEIALNLFAAHGP